MTEITIMTPTYNRAYTLLNLYQSILEQTLNKNLFEWIVVDDGSSDHTEALIHGLILENKISIVYLKKENGGKHRAINYALDYVNSKLFFIVDSDDRIVTNALESIIYWVNSIPEDRIEKFAGVGGLRGYTEQKLIGTTFQQEFIDCSALEREKFNIHGDKAEVYFTKVLNKYRFPDIQGEKFLSECVVWNKMAKDGYCIRWFNEIIYLTEYLPDGLTQNQFKAFSKSPIGYYLYLKTLIDDYDISKFRKMYYYGQYHSVAKTTIKDVQIKFNASYFEIVIGILIDSIVRIKKGRKI